MSIPAWLLDIFAAVMLLVATVSAAQLAAGYPSRWAHVDADITASHLLMGIAMAGMLVTSLQTLPTVVWEAIFAVMIVWFAWSAWRHAQGRGLVALAGGHYAPHLVHSAAMLYVFLALAAPAANGGSGMSGMGGSGGMGTLRLPLLAFIFVLLLAAYSVRDLDRWAGSDGYFHVLRHGPAPAGPGLAPAGTGASPGGGFRRSACRRRPPRCHVAPLRARCGQGLPGHHGPHHGLHAHHRDLNNMRVLSQVGHSPLGQLHRLAGIGPPPT